MRKQILKSLILGATMLGATAMTASAIGTNYFIVGSGVAYTLTANNNSGTPLAAPAIAEWFPVSNGTLGASTSGLTFTGTGDDLTGSTTATVDTFMMHYKESAAATCWSDSLYVVVYTLPPLVVTVTPDNTGFCSNDTLGVTLTAAITNWSSYNFSVLGTYSPTPVDYKNFTWSISPTLALGTTSGTHDETLVQTLPNSAASYTFTATTNYKDITTSMTVQSGKTVSGVKLAGDYSGNNSATPVSVTTAPGTPTVTLN